jgi:hypothetical protein
MTDHEKTVAPEALHETSSLGCRALWSEYQDYKNNAKNAQWLRFAEAAVRGSAFLGISAEVQKLRAEEIADFADAMVKVAKDKNRL